MSQEPQHAKVRSRNEPFVERVATKIWYEQPSEDNPYIARSALCQGYDLYELMERRSFVEVFYLLFRGDLPTSQDAKILETLMIALINPGPRHPATRAAMNVGIGKTNPQHILPVASAVLGGDYLGGGEIENAMRFFRKQQNTNPLSFYSDISDSLVAAQTGTSKDQEISQIIPGFGTRSGGIEVMAAEIAQRLSKIEGAGKSLVWGCELHSSLKSIGLGWLMTGVAAAVFADLGFQPRAGGALFQLLGAPGLVAHGLELSNKPITAMPFVSDENYVIER